MLERAQVAFGLQDKKGAELSKLIAGLRKLFVADEDKSMSLMPAEVKTALMQPSGSPPEGAQSMQQNQSPPPPVGAGGPPSMPNTA